MCDPVHFCRSPKMDLVDNASSKERDTIDQKKSGSTAQHNVHVWKKNWNMTKAVAISC